MRGQDTEHLIIAFIHAHTVHAHSQTFISLPKSPSGRVCGAAALNGEGDGWALAWLGTERSGAPATCWPWVVSSEWA